ncbi:hypothetical protein JMJ77_0007529, partial [Colletotrichum scovillei]
QHAVTHSAVVAAVPKGAPLSPWSHSHDSTATCSLWTPSTRSISQERFFSFLLFLSNSSFSGCTRLSASRTRVTTLASRLSGSGKSSIFPTYRLGSPQYRSQLPISMGKAARSAI